jgi:hypothetical protein
MSTEVHGTPGVGAEILHPPGHAGWVVGDSAGRPYAWCRSALASDAAAAMAFVVPDAAERQRMVDAGWSIWPGCATELVGGGRDLVQASA